MRDEYDFSNAVRAYEVPHLAKLQAEHAALQAGKSRITIRVDATTLAAFKARAAATGGNYQTLMNEALRQYVEGLTLADVVREAVRESLRESVGSS